MQDDSNRPPAPDARRSVRRTARLHTGGRMAAPMRDRPAGDRPVHFLHVGKTGGTAFKHAVERARARCGKLAPMIHLHPHAVRLRDIPEGDRFLFFLRDPVSRFVSGFYSRQRQGRPRYFVPWRPDEEEAFRHFSTPNQLALALSARGAAARDRAEAAMRSIGHVRDSFWKWFDDEAYFLSRRDDLFFIGFQERLAEDFEILKSRLRLPDSAALPAADDVQSHANPRHLDRNLHEEAVRNLRRWYAPDFRFVALCRGIVRTGAPTTPTGPW